MSMKTVTMNLPEELYESMRALQLEGESLASLYRRVIARGVQPDVPESEAEGPGEMTVALAAEVFLNLLPQPQRELILELCHQDQRQPADYLLSYMKIAHDRGETALLLSEADRAPAGETVVHGQTEPVACKYCNKPFIPKRAGQQYCPDPPEDSLEISCGRKAYLAQIHEMRNDEADEFAKELNALPRSA